MAGNDVFLYLVPSDVDADDVRLRDPFNADAGGAVTGALAGGVTVTGTFVASVGAAGPAVGTVLVSGNFSAAAGSAGTLNGSVIVQSSFTAAYGEVGVLLGTVVSIANFSGTHGVTGTLGTFLMPVGIFSGQHFPATAGFFTGLVQLEGAFTGTFSGGVVANDNNPFIPIFTRRRARR
jgi:hypothetical protein